MQILTNGTVNQTTSIDVRLNNILYTNGQTLQLGAHAPNTQFTVNMNVTNKGNTPITFALFIPDRPASFTYSWSYNQTTIPIGQSRIADLIITIPPTAPAGTYSFGTLTFDVT
jgi:hypothetical protein